MDTIWLLIGFAFLVSATGYIITQKVIRPWLFDRKFNKMMNEVVENLKKYNKHSL